MRPLRLERLLEGPDTGLAAAAGGRPPLLLPAAVAVGLAFLVVLVPSPHDDWGEVGVAAALALVVLLLAVAEPLRPRLVFLAAPLSYVAMVALLRDGLGSGASGFGGLLLLPVIWYALVGTLADVLVGLFAMTTAYAVPLLAVGVPAYPSAGWRGVLVNLVVGFVAGLTIQALVSAGRRRASEAAARTTALETIRLALEGQNEQLEHLTRVKDEFLSMVSHELRTPLTSIIGYVEMVREDAPQELSREFAAFLETISRNADRLAKLVDDLLFVARLDSTPLHLGLAPVDVGTLLTESVESARPAAAGKQIVLELDVPAGLPEVNADRTRVAQLIDNLVSNAVKFTPRGGRVSVSAVSSDGSVTVAVADTGMGISRDELPQLFTRFFRASTSTGGHIPGTGLGLWISQEIATAHGTKIEVESEPGTGTRFTFTLPASPAVPV